MQSRAASRSPSTKSAITVEDEDAVSADLREKVKQRTDTLDISIKYSRLDGIVGFFFPEKIAAKLAASAKVSGGTATMLEHEHASPWIVSVYVLPNKNAVKSQSDAHHEAQCTIDTGNQQGNIVSKSFLVDVLDYSESNFSKLTKSEEHGGTSVTGQRVVPDGAVNLTWYHRGSDRVFRNMRFLVLPDAQCDLVIGARSIKKHNLLSPPNFMVNKQVLKVASISEELQTLILQEKKSRDKLKTLRLKQTEADEKDNKQEVERLQGDIVKAEKVFKIDEFYTELCRRKIELKAKPQDENLKKIIAGIENDLVAEGEKLPEEPKTNGHTARK